MDKIGIQPEVWQTVVSAADTSITNVADIQVVRIEKTTLGRMKQFVSLQEKAKTLLAAYKSFGHARTGQMLAVGEKIVADDQAFAGKFDKNTANVRFK